MFEKMVVGENTCLGKTIYAFSDFNKHIAVVKARDW
jgi:hypothetical protein